MNLFAEPTWLWALLALPLVGVVLWGLWRRRLRAARRWASIGLWGRLLPGYRPRRLVASGTLLVVSLLALLLALARPRWGQSQQEVDLEGVDVVFVLDTSLSMATKDVAPSRLWVAQTIIRRMVESLPEHRYALVQAEGDGVVMIPLTADSAIVDLLLDTVEPGSLPTPGTRLAPALDKARALFSDEGGKHRAMVVVSDGEDHGSELEVARKALAEAGIVVHAVGVGTTQGQPLELPQGYGDDLASRLQDGSSALGGRVEYKRDEDGNVVVSRLREETLEALARETGGRYLRATSASVDTGRILEAIRGMERRSYGAEVVSSLEERFQWPLALAAIALGLHLLLPPFRPRPTEEAL